MTTKDFWSNHKKPILGLAPMDGYSDSAFRRVCRSINPEIVIVTEFTSADGLHHGAKRLKEKLWFHDSEKPVIAQIFGKNVETFISATKVCEDMGFAGIDLNMGCPAKKVVRSEHGVALRRNPKKAFELIEAVANCTTLPVSVKTRLGWTDASDLVEFGVGAQNAGANMICIHARTYQEPYNVPPQYEAVYALKDKVSIPVLGNGGIESYDDIFDKIGNLDGMLIGQATFGNPWIFSPKGKPTRFQDRVDTILNHSKWLIEHKGETIGCREIRKHLVCYVRGFKGAKDYRSRLVRVSSYQEIEDLIMEISNNRPS